MNTSQPPARKTLPRTPGAWTNQAACKGMATEIFFPERGGAITPAQAVCDRCPVQTACREYATAAIEKFGIWGGVSERNRRAVRRQRLQETAA